MKPKQPKRWLVPLIAYGVVLLLYLFGCTAVYLSEMRLAENGLLARRELPFDSFYAEGVLLRENAEGGTDLVSSDPDPKMIYSPGEPFRISRLTFRAETSNKPGGEMMLYYTTQPDETFGEHRRLSARLAADGSWYFDLNGREVTGIRFDPDNRGGVLFRNWSIVLNEEKPLVDYYLPDARAVFALLFLPAFASAVVLEAGHIQRDYFLGRKGKGKSKK